MARKNTTSGYPISNHEDDDDEQDAGEDSDDLHHSSYRFRHRERFKEQRTHPDRVGKYTKKFR